MKQSLKIILTGVMMVGISFPLMLAIGHFVPSLMNNMTLDYFIVNFTSLDANLILFYPIVVALFQLLSKNRQIIFLIKGVLVTSCFIIVMMLIAITTALFTWNEQARGGLLPDYYKAQPFDYYWTVFIVAAILLSLTAIYSNKNKNLQEIENSNILDEN